MTSSIGSVPPPGPLSYTGSVFVQFITRTFNPETTFNTFQIGTIWLNTASSIAYILVSKAQGVAIWAPIGGSPGNLETITTPDMTVVVPTAGNINFLNGTGMNITGSGSNITFNVSGTVADLYTCDSGTATPASNNLIITGGTTGLTTLGSGHTVALTGTLGVPNGGTGATTLTGVLTGFGTGPFRASPVTQYSILLGGASNGVNSLGVATNGQLPIGSNGTNPVLGNLTSTGGSLTITNGAGTINLDAANYAEGTWTPTLLGATTAGTTTYLSQEGTYTRFFNVVVVSCIIQISAATGTGDATIGGFPFNFFAPNSGAATQVGGAWTWPTGTTMVCVEGGPSTSTAVLKCSGSAINAANMQMTNGALALFFSMIYQVS